MCRDIQHNASQHNDMLHNVNQHNYIQHNDTHHNGTQHNGTLRCDGECRYAFLSQISPLGFMSICRMP
jgi:hypothetical protein